MSFLRYTLSTLLILFSLSLFSQGIKWMSWTEAVEANAKVPKKIFVDVYTDWCGWCKRMDQSTFTDTAVVATMNKYFYAVKLNAEQKESIFWRDMEFKWIEGGRNGFNSLALELLDRQMSFPSFVMLDKEFARISISPGYKEPPALLKELKYAYDELYRTMSWDDYRSKS
jgi:thioredoxin-related protein